MAVSGQHDFVAGFGAADQLGKLGFGVGDGNTHNSLQSKLR
jgi:hypothetical protein